jgi:hypothetical protein
LKVLIATPAHDGKLDVWYTTSLVNTVRVAQANNVFIHPVFMSYDALVQRARNDLIALAIEGEYDALIFIDADMEWNPLWVMELIARPEDVVGGTARKKTDEAEIYVLKTSDLTVHPNGLIKCEGLGTGFVKLSRKALQALWDNSPQYTNEGKVRRMVCNVEVIDGQLYSEDVSMFRKLNALGFDCWLNPRMTCAHIGTKKFVGNLQNYLAKGENSNA